MSRSSAAIVTNSYTLKKPAQLDHASPRTRRISIENASCSPPPNPKLRIRWAIDGPIQYEANRSSVSSSRRS